jgi:ankyrin repeat protein
LITAAGKNHVDIVKDLVEEGGADVNQAMDDGFTPAFVA